MQYDKQDQDRAEHLRDYCNEWANLIVRRESGYDADYQPAPLSEDEAARCKALDDELSQWNSYIAEKYPNDWFCPLSLNLAAFEENVWQQQDESKASA